MIVCGWCARATEREWCDHCGRDPRIPWIQRNTEPPQIATAGAGRPGLDEDSIRTRWAAARATLGFDASLERMAEYLDRSPRTVRDWRRRYGLR